MGLLYTFAAAAGLGWAVFSFLLGHLGGDAAGDGHAAELGGHDGGDGDGGGDGADAVHAGHGAAHHGLPLLSPTVIASGAAGFGFTGLALRALGLPAAVHAPGAVAGGVGLALFLAFFLARAVRGMETTSAVSPSAFEGLEAEVIVPVPARGVGEIAFEHNGTRLAGAARARDGAPRRRGERVLITRVRADGLYEVEPLALPASTTPEPTP
jgi:membrane protein implicated in regulation of membrane protease activity